MAEVTDGQARADTAGLRSDDPVRPTVRPENLLLFEATGPRAKDD
ncbi:hypothetical protein [Streptomyces longisporus]